MNTLAIKQDPEDICLWADGTWCYRDELPQYSHMSDDYEVVPFNTVRYWDLQSELDAWNSPEHEAYLESLCATVNA